MLWVEKGWAEHRQEASKANYDRVIQNKGQERKEDKNQTVKQQEMRDHQK